MLENIKKRDKRVVRILSIVTILSIICCVTLIIVAAHKPGSDEFCARCHSMEQSYNSWKKTVACQTGCLSCHTHDKSGRTLSVEIEDSNCTTIECHPVDKLTSKVSNFKEAFPFNHQTHLKEYSNNLRVKCTGCHSYLGNDAQEGGGARHFGIDEGTCFVCHFIRGKSPLLTAKDKIKVDECSLCHKDVEVKVMIYEKDLDHMKFEKELKVKCSDCHFDIVHGGGDVEGRNCYRCHAKIPKEYQGAERMHNDHVEEHKVPCSPCHNAILHEWGGEYTTNILPHKDSVTGNEDSLSAPDAASRTIQKVVPVDSGDMAYVFKREPYLIQRELYAGKGGVGIEGSPDPMYLSTVNCIACHKEKNMSVNPMSCNVCHEKGFDKTMAEQKEYITGLLSLLSESLENPPKKDVSSDLIDESLHNYNLITNDGSLGVHNIKYTKDLINYSIQNLR